MSGRTNRPYYFETFNNRHGAYHMIFFLCPTALVFSFYGVKYKNVQ
jgi:hypothetical protein